MKDATKMFCVKLQFLPVSNTELESDPDEFRIEGAYIRY